MTLASVVAAALLAVAGPPNVVLPNVVLPNAARPNAVVQDRTIQGIIRTRDSVPLVGATLWLVSTTTGDSTIAASSGFDGTYKFTLPVRTTSALHVQRRGFRDARVPIDSARLARRTVSMDPIVLEALAEPLATVVVQDDGVYNGPAAAFYRRVATRRGDYVTRTEIERLAPLRTSNLLRGMRGLMLETSRGGGTLVRARGRNCYASIWVDGMSMGARAFDVDAISPVGLIGIEVYAQFGTMPMEYQSFEGSSCGAVGFWTRRGAMSSGAAFDPPSIPDPASVRLQSEVDEPVRLVGATAFAPSYPNEARVNGIGGAVTVELVVDSTGAIERASAGVVSTAAPMLGDAAVDAVAKLRFTPARKDGRPVRQLVHLVAVFRPTLGARGR